MTDAPVRIAAFDLDDTVLRGDSQLLFLRYLTRRRLAPAALLLEVAGYFALHQLGVPLDVPRLYERIVVRGLRAPADTVRDAMRDFAMTRLQVRLRRDARSEIARLQAAGCHVVLLSASLEPILVATARELAVDGVIGTQLKLNGSGRLVVDGEMIYGQAKLRALRRYADRRFPAWRLEYAFGNDYGDRFLLEAAVHPVAVAASRRLRATAARAGWRTATWR